MDMVHLSKTPKRLLGCTIMCHGGIIQPVEKHSSKWSRKEGSVKITHNFQRINISNV